MEFKARLRPGALSLAPWRQRILPILQEGSCPMLRLVCSAVAAAALVMIPAAISTYSGQALAQATDKAATTDKADKGKATTTTTKAAKKKKRELTAGQKSARERQRQW